MTPKAEQAAKATYKLIAVGDTTTLSGEAAVKLQNPPAEGRSILRTFLQLLNPLNPLNPLNLGPPLAAPYNMYIKFHLQNNFHYATIILLGWPGFFKCKVCKFLLTCALCL